MSPTGITGTHWDSAMFTVRPAADRGQTSLGWLESFHTFSFGDYVDPAHVHFRGLRVINDDVIAAGQGFGTHPHRDMEILTWVLAGELEHRDSLGSGGVIRPGDWQAMSAGTGVRHSEFNPSPADPVRLLQIWLVPDRRGHTPRYAQKSFPSTGAGGRWRLVASPDGADGSLPIHADARVYSGAFGPGETAALPLAAGRGAYLQVATGSVTVGGHTLRAGDGVAVEGESAVGVTGVEAGEVVLFDLG